MLKLILEVIHLTIAVIDLVVLLIWLFN